MEGLDPTDLQIVKMLCEDGQQDSEALSKKLHLSAATVRRRVKRLMESGTLRIVAVVDPAKFGLHLTAVLAFDVAHDRMVSVVEALSQRPEIRWVSATTGRYDILAQARFESNEKLAEFVQNELPKIEGVRDCETFMCLEPKRRFGNFVTMYPIT